MMYGYARVSSVTQDHARQVAELQAAGCERIYTEKASAAAGRRRPALRQVVADLQPGDCLTVTQLNRVARSARDALNVLAEVTGKGASFRSLRETWADTTTPAGRLAVTVFSGFAEFDREMILERTGEGRRAAKARGVRLGRPATLTARQRAYVREQRANDAASIGELANLLNVSRSTITRACRDSKDDAEPRAVAHLPGCAVFGASIGAPMRCTCGAWAPAGGAQIDIQELI